MTQHDPLHLRDAQEQREQRGELPTCEELWDALGKTLSLEQWAAQMNALFPMPRVEAELAASRERTATTSARVALLCAEADRRHADAEAALARVDAEGQP